MIVMSVEEDVNEIQWKLGWNPKITIIAVTVLFTIVGAAIDAVGTFFVLGILAGGAVYVWGTRTINDNYDSFLSRFISESERKGARGIEVDSANTYSLTYGMGDSPPLVEPSKTYKTNTLVVTDASVNVNKGAEFDMKSRESVAGGSNRELYYDQISAVESHQDGRRSVLEIRTSGGDTIGVGSTNTDTVDAAMSDVRKRVREAKR
ncbi:hypothetical protein GCM10009060_23480 [Halorubrum trapanicum]